MCLKIQADVITHEPKPLCIRADGRRHAAKEKQDSRTTGCPLYHTE